jgi:ABC-2 type transport system permease protein
MNGRVTLRLILKDWQLNGAVIALSIIGGLAGLGVLLVGGQTAIVLGAIFFFLSMVICASFLPTLNIVNERKKQTLAFMMSLPISAAQYGIAKLISTLGMFLIPWMTLIAAALYMILCRHVLPNGTIPTTLILAALPLIGFCLITGTVLVAESEGWAIAATVVVNASYSIAWYLLVSRANYLTRTWTDPAAVWNALTMKSLVAEFAAVLVILALTILLQSHKRDFV